MSDRQPTNEVFNDIKSKSIEVWRTESNDGGYADGKIKYIETVENYKDNWNAIIGLFDEANQLKLMCLLGGESLWFLYTMKGHYSLGVPHLLLDKYVPNWYKREMP